MKYIAVILFLFMLALGKAGSAWGGDYGPGPVPNGAMPCGSYGMSATTPCVPNGDQICDEWYNSSGGAITPPNCGPANPEGGVKQWTDSDGQHCRQFVYADGSPESSVACWWPTKPIPAGENSEGWKCYAQEYTAGPDQGLLAPGPLNCPDPTPSNDTLKTWVNP